MTASAAARPARPRARAAGRPARPRRARARPARRRSTAPATCSCATARIAEIARAGQRSSAPDGAEVVDGAGRHLLPGLRRPARAPAHARPGAQGGPRDRHPRRRRRRLLRASSRCRTPTRWSTRAPLLRSLRDAAAREARIPVGFLAAITRGLRRRGADRDGRAARRGRARLHRRRQPGRQRRDAAQGARSTSACAAA